MQTVLQYLKDHKNFFFATCEGGQPRVRPFGAITAFEGKLYIVTSNQKDVYRQMIDNPQIELCCMGNAGDWLRVAATAVLDPRREAKVHMLDDNEILKTLYAPDDGIVEVFYLKDVTATFATFTEEPKVITF